MNKIELIPVKYADKEILRRLLELYQYDSSEFNDDEPDAQGWYGYKYLDHYWTDKGRFAYFLHSDSKLVGLVMVSVFKENGQTINSISEFWVMRKYHKLGIGQKTARMIFDLHPGIWHICIEKENLPAQKFWQKVIAEYANNQYNAIAKEYWQGPVLEFVNN